MGSQTEEQEALRESAKQIFRPSRPVTSAEFLYGRGEKLHGLLENLEIPGRSVFIYGERGVGKTSLALTAAFLFNSSAFKPVFVSCHPDMTFSKLITHIAKRLLGIPVFQKTKTTRMAEASANLSIFKLAAKIEAGDGELPSELDINDAVELLDQITPEDQHSVVVVDELDTLTRPETKRDIAFFIKQLGDRECRVKFVFAGIADDVNDLLTQHESASRYMATVKLDRLPLDILRDMLTKGFQALDVKIWESYALRIATIADGFAHFTHLVGLKLALQIINHKSAPREVESSDLASAIEASIEDSEAWLKQSYDQAIQKYKDRYEPVLWAAADHWELIRSTEQMFEAYGRICSDSKHTPLARRNFSLALNVMKQPTHGEVLRSPRASWYKFRQTMLRGYCRMVAESKGVKIGTDYFARQQLQAAATAAVIPEPEPTQEELAFFDSQEPGPDET